MTLAYAYATKTEAEAAVADGTALAFFRPFLDIAIAKIDSDDRPFYSDKFFRLHVGMRNRKRHSWDPVSWQVYLHFGEGVDRSWGTTDIIMRKDGSVNQETLNAIVWHMAYRRGSADRAQKAKAANRNTLDALPYQYRPYVEVESSADCFRLSFREGGIQFSRTVKFDEIVPILTALQTAAAAIDGIRYPDQQEK